MFGQFCGWLFSVVAAFFIGTSVADTREPADSELQQKIQGHMDVIVDESAGIIDDVAEEFRKNEQVQEAEDFIDDVKEIAQDTADDIEAHFGEKKEAEAEEMTEDAGDAAEAEAESEADTGKTRAENADEGV